MFNLDTINGALLVVTGINLFYGLIVFLSNPKDKAVRLFSGVVLSVMFWTLSMFLFRGLADDTYVLLSARILYLSAAAIPFIFLYFTFIFPNKNNMGLKWRIYLIPVPFLIASIISIVPNSLIRSVSTGLDQPIIDFDKNLYLVYVTYIIGYFSWAYLNLFSKFFKLKGEQKTQIVYVTIGTLSATMVGVVTNLFLPLFGVFTYNWMGQIAVAIMVVLISYAVLKHNLFNIKVVLTEILTVLLWGVIFSRILFSTGLREQIISTIVFLLSILLGVFIIKSVRSEIASREKIQKLAEDLEKANTRLMELDQQKSEFVSIASHQLRAPLTAIKGYSSMILEGSFGDIGVKAREAIGKVLQSSEHLVRLVEDLLNISRIEMGRMEYIFTTVDLSKMAQDIINALYPNAQKANLTLTLETDDKGPYNTLADQEKIRQVVLNLVDNAIKYTPKGFVRVNITRNEQAKKILLSVTDSGVGIAPEVKERLFEKFSRGDSKSKSLFVNGTGLGLYVAKEMMRAHGGNIWAESSGDGQGSTFFVEFKAV